MGSLVLTVGTGSTWAMRATLVLAMSGLEWQEQVFDLEDARSLQRLKRVAPAGLVPGSTTVSCASTTPQPSPSTCTSCARGATSIRRIGRAGAGAQPVPSCTPVFARSAPCRLLPRRADPERAAGGDPGELARLQTLWSQARGPFYFDEAGILDAFYA